MAMWAPVLTSACWTIFASKNRLNVCVRTITRPTITNNNTKVGIVMSAMRMAFFLFIAVTSASALERLPQRHEPLRGLYAWRRVQVMSNVDAQGAYGRVIPKPETNGAGVIAYELMEANLAVHVAAVIEEHAAQAALQRNRKAGLGIHDGGHVPADGNADERARRSVAWIAAYSDRPLGSGAVDRKSAERIAATGEKALA